MPEQSGTPFPRMPMLAISMGLISHGYVLTSLFPYVGYMVQHLGVTDDKDEAGYYAGYLSSAFMVGRFGSSYLWGRFADRYGRLPVMYIGLSSVVILSIAFGLSTSFSQAMACRFMLGLMNGLIAVAKTLISEVCGKEHEVVGMTFVTGCWSAGMIIGPGLGGLLAEPAIHYPNHFSEFGLFGRFPYLLPNLFGAGLGMLGLPMVYFFLKETGDVQNTKRAAGFKPLPMSEDADISAEEGRIVEMIPLTQENSLDEDGITDDAAAAASELQSGGLVGKGAPPRRSIMVVDGKPQWDKDDFLSGNIPGNISVRSGSDKEVLEQDSGREINQNVPSAGSINDKHREGARGSSLPTWHHHNQLQHQKERKQQGQNLAIVNREVLSSGNGSNNGSLRAIRLEDPRGTKGGELIVSHGGDDIGVGARSACARECLVPVKLLRERRVRRVLLVYGLFSFINIGNQEVYPLWALSTMANGGLDWTTKQIGQFLDMGFDEMYPLWALSTIPRGGLDWTTTEIGQALSLCGMIMLVFQLSVFPRLLKRVGVTMSQRCGSLLPIPVYLTFPLISRLHGSGAPLLTASLCLLFLINTCASAIFVNMALVTNNLVDASRRATVNGLSMTLGSLAKAAGPTTFSTVFAWSISGSDHALPLDYHLVFYCSAVGMAFVAYVGWNVITQEALDSAATADAGGTLANGAETAGGNIVRAREGDDIGMPLKEER